MNERINTEAEVIGSEYARGQIEKCVIQVELNKDGGLSMKEAYLLIIDTNGWIRWITDDQPTVYESYRYRFFVTNDGYRIIEEGEKTDEDWLEIDVDIKKKHEKHE